MKTYLCISQTLRGYENLALDEYFLDTVGQDEMILYLYVNRNAVIVGKNQNPYKECDLAAMEKDGVELVRRVSGGGAVYHDEGNLNFSFIAGPGRYDLDKQIGAIRETLLSLGVECAFSGRNDLLAAGRKFSGN
ncbi:MAG: lipoate--protein ligase family protein, partial [Clostridia bacterium]|nr:lipoate--protein ligase family protein [Clostridia bacterium]